MTTNDKKLGYQRTYREKNKERLAAYHKMWRERKRQQNPEYMKEYMKNWRIKQKRYDLALNQLMHLYSAKTLTMEHVHSILQPLCNPQD